MQMIFGIECMLINGIIMYGYVYMQNYPCRALFNIIIMVNTLHRNRIILKVSYSVSHVERKALSLPGQAPQKSPTQDGQTYWRMTKNLSSNI